MSLDQARHAIMHHDITRDIASTERTARLLEAIKAETRWLLIAAPPRNFRNDVDSASDDRAALLSAWPAIRNRRRHLPAYLMTSFYDLVADYASIFAHLIEIRRQRAADRIAQ